jgi:N-acetylglucosamine kinase-like BadF-type ATPase
VRRFLGVDGGGTKTALCLVSDEGAVLATVEAPTCYYLGSGSTHGVELVSEVLGQAVPEVCARAGISPGEVDFAFFGLPAYGEVSGDLAALDAAPGGTLGHDRYRCDNDMVCGWAGSLALADGINVISGTGSMAYGQRGGRQARVGGWGELFGDEGSGYWVGLRGLRAFAQMSDGRIAAGPLLDVLRGHLGLAADLDLVDVVLNRWRGDRQQVAALSRPVVAAARLGDAAAGQILAGAAAELARLVDAARQRLGFSADDLVPVSYSGGMFSVSELLKVFPRELRATGGRFDLRAPQHSPVLGAALYAAQVAGTPLDPAAVDRLQGE